jgi:hypothetical protein
MQDEDEIRAYIKALELENVRLKQQFFEAMFNLERACCEGEGYTEEYGWPVGDHVPQTMADSIISRLKGEEIMGAFCARCQTPIYWQECPTGGWWIHFQHPEDNHDGTPMDLPEEMTSERLRHMAQVFTRQAPLWKGYARMLNEWADWVDSITIEVEAEQDAASSEAVGGETQGEG